MQCCLLITFARHTLLQKNIEKLLELTDKLYIYQNKENEHYREQCEIVSSIIKKFDDSKITFFRPPTHLESEDSIKFAITEFFKNEKVGIVLEDDCTPTENLFHLHRKLTEQSQLPNRYVINGFNPEPNGHKKVYIKRNVYLHVWGWATNSKTWQDFLSDYEIRNNFCNSESFKKLSLLQKFYWLLIYQLVKIKKIRSWDYKFQNFLWRENIAIYSPSENFVHNLGADEFSNFLKKDESNVANIKANVDDLEFHGLSNDVSCANSISKNHYRINKRRVIELMIIWFSSVKMKNK